MKADDPLPEMAVYEAVVVYLHAYAHLGGQDGVVRIADSSLATHLCRNAAPLGHLREAA